MPQSPLEPGKGKLVLVLGLLSVLGLVLFSIWFIISKPFGQEESFLSRFFGLAVVISSPFTFVFAIIATVMGYRELNRIDKGITDPAKRKSAAAGMRLGVVGSMLLPIGFAVTLSRYSEAGISKVRDSIIVELSDLSLSAYQHRIRPALEGGGDGAYTGYRMPAELSITDWGIYTALVLHTDTIQFTAKWLMDSTSTLTVKIGPDGRPIANSWIYTGDFQ